MKIKIFCEAGYSYGLGHLKRCVRLKNLLLPFYPDISIYYDGEKIPHERQHCQWSNQAIFFDLLTDTDIAIIDSYQAGLDFYRQASEKTKRLIILDDNCRLHYPQNAIILNGALNAQTLYPTTKNHLCGIEFAIIDKQFFCIKTPQKNVQNILITFGGSDCGQMSQKVVHLIENRPYTNHIVLPLNHKQHIPPLNKNKIYQNISSSKMADLMKQCDIAISAGGGTLNELAMSHVPTLIIPTASNQIFQSQQWALKGVMKITSLKNLNIDLDTIIPMQTRKEMILKSHSIIFGNLLLENLLAIISASKS
ncbi:glycosyltransferase [Helicobacter sp. 11S03491-1]|uniref:glycosyltransferase n=1 Tax=Helicobacter sp. 11S03491-1 TaxID=1476196 RepID=UPI000BA5309A|nr:glycosyltransferase [Helicobacter sp. 11S03491-1]PAF41151.1 hypothetical protein BKH45_07950 [Helicobacter sp. 11S03491-1]